MEIQQHDGVVVDVAGSRQGFAELLREEGDVSREGEGGARACVCSPPLTPLFIGEGARGAGPSRWDLEGPAPPWTPI